MRLQLPSLVVRQILISRQDASHSSHTLLTQFLSHTTTPTGWALLLSPGPWLVGTTKSIRAREPTLLWNH
jgi:hypothetical protein